MSHEERVQLTISGPVAHLELARPDQRNAIDAAMVEAIADAVDTIETDQNIRSLLISGRGPSFCVGGDLKYFVGRLDTLEDEFRHMIGLWHATLPRLAAFPFPVVTAIQ